MTKTILQLLKISTVVILFWLSIIHGNLYASETSMDTVVFEVTVKNYHSEIIIHNSSNWQFKLLNGSPAAKIMIKASPSDKNIQSSLYIDPQLPDKSGVKSVRFLPLSPDNYLISLELLESLPFEWSDTDKNRILLKDGHLFDESELNYRRGLTHQKQGMLKEALNLYRSAIFENRKHANAYFKAAQIRWTWNQNQLAEINFKHAERLGCDSLILYKQMADFYKSDGRLELAEKYEEIYDQKLTSEQQKSYLTETTQEDPEEQKIILPPDSSVNPLINTEIVEPIKAERKGDLNSNNRILFYAVGSFFLLIFIGLWFYRRFRVETNLKVNLRENIPDSYIGSELKPATGESIRSQTFEKIRSKKELITTETDPENSNEERPETNDPDNENQMDTIETLETDFSLDINVDFENDYLDELQEMDLYDNVLEQKQNTSSSSNIASEIFRLYDSNIEIQEIARRLGIGQGEVELFIKFKQDIYHHP